MWARMPSLLPGTTIKSSNLERAWKIHHLWCMHSNAFTEGTTVKIESCRSNVFHNNASDALVEVFSRTLQHRLTRSRIKPGRLQVTLPESCAAADRSKVVCRSPGTKRRRVARTCRPPESFVCAAFFPIRTPFWSRLPKRNLKPSSLLSSFFCSLALRQLGFIFDLRLYEHSASGSLGPSMQRCHSLINPTALGLC